MTNTRGARAAAQRSARGIASFGADRRSHKTGTPGGSSNGADFEAAVAEAIASFIRAIGRRGRGNSLHGVVQDVSQRRRRGLLLRGPGRYSILFTEEPKALRAIDAPLAVDPNVDLGFKKSVELADVLGRPRAEGSVRFDMVALLLRDDTPMESMLFEFKFGKSSNGRRLDGNAHERLAFQTLAFMLWSERSEHRVSLTVIAASAFQQYKNKYEQSFRVIGDKLSTLVPTFHWRFLSSRKEYADFFLALDTFIQGGTLP